LKSGASGLVVSVNTSAAKGTVKEPQAEAVLRENYGIEGDAHAGSWPRQISLLAEESISKMSAQGIPGLKPGDFAENITTRGIELYTLPVGTVLALGDCLAEITRIGKECHKDCAIRQKTGNCIMPSEGVFARVIRGGVLRAGDHIKIEKCSG
jgi:cyclic pyranopterin phosphate synthase